MLPVSLKDNKSNVSVVISPHGEMITAPFSPNQIQHYKMDMINTAYVFAPPLVGSSMRLQNILMYGSKNVGVNDATVVIYTSLDPTATAGTTVMEFEVPEKQSRDLINLNIALPEGVYLLATTNDNDIYMTMMGYYIHNSI